MVFVHVTRCVKTVQPFFVFLAVAAVHCLIYCLNISVCLLCALVLLHYAGGFIHQMCNSKEVLMFHFKEVLIPLYSHFGGCSLW